MKKYNSKLKIVIVTIISMYLLTINSYSHSGRTDSNGGHRDNNNVSGLGSYHYHCGGHPAHLHPNGICPYSTSSSSVESSSKSTPSTSSLLATTTSSKEYTSKKNTYNDKSNTMQKNSKEENSEDSNELGKVLALGLLGGGGYIGYKKYKKNTKNRL